MFLVKYRWARPFVVFCFMICLVIITLLLNIKALNIIFIPVFLFGIYNLVIEMWVALAFISPGNRKKEFKSVGWISKFHDLDSKIHSTSYFDNQIRPLVIIIHGWRSSASSMLGRAENYINMGFHVIIFELPGHGKSQPVSKWTAGHASTTFNEFYENLSENFDMELIDGIYFHGHSMGGFVLLRFDKLIRNNDPKIMGYVLESPMTCYSLIFEESLRNLKIPKFAEKKFWNRLSAHFNEINPKISNVTKISDVDTPDWGIIRNNCLVIQAKHDNRLGLDHYHRLIEHQQEVTGFNFQHHLVAGLTHAGARINQDRNALIKLWFDELIDHSDSAKSA